MNFNMTARHRKQRIAYETRKVKYLGQIRELRSERASAGKIAERLKVGRSFVYRVMKEERLLDEHLFPDEP